MIVLTGATGFLGGELLVRLLEDGRDVVALVRAPDDAAAQARLDETLALLLPPGAALPGTVRAVAADLERPGLGLTPGRRAALARDAETVVHCAASVQFALPQEDAWRINVEGTRAMLDLAAGARALDRFVHVSTAYVAGDRAGRCHEHEGYVGQTPRNTYESTKLAAEREVRSSGLPSPAIVRPSIVVGDSRTGWTPAFNVIYWPLQAFARGLFPVVPGDPRGRVDIVPVDTVAGALLEAVRGPRLSGAVHVVAGDDAPTAQQLATLASRAFGAAVPQFVEPGAAPEVEERAGVFLPYFRFRGVFDAQRGRQLGFVPPPIGEYFDVLLRYARLARWGKRPVTRWEAAAAESSVAAA